MSTITIVTSVISNYYINDKFENVESEGTGYAQQLMADIMFHLCVNLTGWYLRYVCDINMRRGFLDKRGCIETTFRLKYEKEQEVRVDAGSGSLDLLILGELAPQHHPQTHRLPGGGGGQQLP